MLSNHSASLSTKVSMIIRRLLALAPLTACLALGAQPSPAHAQEAAVADSAIRRDGQTSATAAASCWQIKQDDPKSADGAYWLQTPSMDAPQQYFCDQTTDGGGWVLIGRGREGWETWSQGQGDPAELTTRDRVPADFPVVQLANQDVTQLLDGEDVSSLEDGMRVVRALSPSGDSWQTVNMRFNQMKDFVWPFKSGIYVSYRINSSPYWYSGRIWDGFGMDSGFKHVNMTTQASTSHQLGFAYGNWSFIRGDVRSDSTFVLDSGPTYLPYSEVYLRPRISNDDQDYQRLPDEGIGAETVTPAVSEFAANIAWGVTGNLNGSIQENSIQTQAFEQIGDTMFVGGNFTGVKNGTTGEEHASSGLAAFNAATGEWIQGLTFQFDNQVKDLIELPNGKLLAVGDFTVVNGAQHSGSVMIDPTTGQVDESWDLQIVNGLSSGVLSVRAAILSGDYIYFAGSFTHLSGQGAKRVYGRNSARTSIEGKPDRSWNPEFNGTVMAADVDPENTYYYAGGRFSTSRSTKADSATRVTTDAQAAVDTSFTFVPSHYNGTYQQAVKIVDDKVYFAGSQHSLFGYLRNQGMERVSTTIAQNGGDLQALELSDNGILYGSCHCSDFFYEDASVYYFESNFTRANEAQWIGAWDAATGKHIGWTPYRLKSLRSTGAWALEMDDAGNLWAGGDFTYSFSSTSRGQWSGGFVRFDKRDNEPPATPQHLRSLSSDEDSVTLAWNPVVDAVSYEIIRDDRVIATTTDTAIDAARGGEERYFVRAVDQAGNRSATTAVFQAPAVGEVDESNPVLVEDLDEWTYLWSAQTPAADWTSLGFDDSSWAQGRAPIGYGDSTLNTVIDTTQQTSRPITTYFRKTFSVADPTQIGGIELSYVADDGALVYINGTEVHRSRMDEGSVNAQTRASASVNVSQANADRASVLVPASLLVAGDNVIAVETHLNYRSSRTMSMQARVTKVAAQDMPEPEPQDTPEIEDVPEEEPAETGLETIDATALDAGDLIATGTHWSYWASSQAPDAAWKTDLDVSSWSQGAAPIGWGARTVQTGLDFLSTDRPAAYYFVRDMNLGTIGSGSALSLSVLADDGAVVYVNGVEVGRERMGEGDVLHSHRAAASISYANAMKTQMIIDVPADLLVDGVNRIAVETHINYLSSPSMVFDVTAAHFVR
ncbi:fibrinogen-like YCDxxxxGGGW domain-containing protein [Schaalia vaccimaxillae]|uniref:fibrinogen-like YCDxxxxGGGW domain-containing protein n=1 Tax=Schaalia vaccimaxillae TaxID=183916 RepID=UPI001FB16952|nr:fibrinogen-like YCDxxxxGGGW domain-containing protein [Schaalia vaccimaxillae]